MNISSTDANEELIKLASREERYDKIQDLVDQVNLSDISSIRQSVSAIVRVINDPKSTVQELKDIILMDPPLAARVLKTANSAYYSRSFSRSFSEIEQAIIWMGTEVIKELALSQKVCEIFESEQVYDAYSRRALWRHSIAVALTAKAIYRKEFGLKGENAYVAGLLHDIGLIAEDQFMQKEFRYILRMAKSKNMDISEAECNLLGYDHAEVGGAICSSWSLPDELVAAITGHVNPARVDIKHSRLASALFVSDYYCQINGFGFGIVPPKNPDIYKDALDTTEIKPHALGLIFKSVEQDLTEMEEKGLI
jgi:putative nucleotidyltransferase with HDIG domain